MSNSIPRVDPSELGIADLDWLQINWNGRVLHHADLDATKREELESMGVVETITTACGRLAFARIPGVLSRLNEPRCITCCNRLGYPLGVGSPKNDPAIRALLGLPEVASHRR